MTADGEVDWWCGPEFDSHPLAWSLLDDQGGCARWLQTSMVEADMRPAGPIADTTLRFDGGDVACRDGLVGADGGVALVRLVRAIGDAPVSVSHELRLGGFDGPWVKWSGPDGSLDGLPISVIGELDHRFEEGWVRTEFLARPDRWTGLAVVLGGGGQVDLPSLINSLERAQDDVHSVIAAAHLPRRHPDRAADALAVLRSCTFAPTGAIVASPTTSLPEVAGGDRQWDYRYCWLRDAGLAASVASLLGERNTAQQYLGFVKSLAEPLPPVVTVRGDSVPTERAVEGVGGWGGSTPVRVGNDAGAQVQYDALGLVVEAVSVYVQTGGALDDGTWSLVERIANQIATNPCDDEESNGIWELREPALLVSADIGRWLALDRAIWIARGWRPLTKRRHWKRARSVYRNRVLDALRPDGGLPQAYGGPPRADASALMIPMFGMLGRRDRRSHRVVDAVLDDLGVAPFVYRYQPDGTDGLAPGEGAFVPVCFWAVSALAALGRVDEARGRFDELCARLPRLLSEEFDPANDVALGNTPLVWSHMEMARALYVLDAAERRARWGLAGLWIWRLARYAQLRWSPVRS